MADAIPVHSDKKDPKAAKPSALPADVIADLTEQIRSQLKAEASPAPVAVESPYKGTKGAKLGSHDAVRKDN